MQVLFLLILRVYLAVNAEYFLPNVRELIPTKHVHDLSQADDDQNDNYYLIDDDSMSTIRGKRLESLERFQSNVKKLLPGLRYIDERDEDNQQESTFQTLRTVYKQTWNIPSTSDINDAYPLLSILLKSDGYQPESAHSKMPLLFPPRQEMVHTSRKRNSAITPPSRDWCRLIGYRVCPRANLG